MNALLTDYDDRTLAVFLEILRKSNAATREQTARIRAASRGGEGGEFATPLGSVESGRLVFANGTSQLILRAASGMEDLYQANFEGAGPKVEVEDGTVTFRYTRRFGGLFERRDHSGQITLNAAVPWEVEVRGGAYKIEADLSALKLTSFVLKGGISDLTLRLPEPSGTVPLRVAGGASEIVVRRPPHVAANVRLKGWASQLTFDDQTFGAVGNDVRLQSPGYEDAAGRYDIEISGSASDITVATSR